MFLDLSTSYLKMELSKAGFYRPFSSLCIWTNFLSNIYIYIELRALGVISGVLVLVLSLMLTISQYNVNSCAVALCGSAV